jgi:hypothetical protein
VAKGDNPFGSEPPENPFGSSPSTDPFGRPIEGSDDAFAAPAPADQSRLPSPSPPSDDAWRSTPAPPPSGDYAAPPVSGRRAETAIPAVVLGIVGIILCPLCAPFAWSLGRKAERQVDASGGALAGRGEATAGKILGIVGTVLMVIWIVALVGLLAVGSSVDSGSGTTTTTYQF